MYAFQRLIWQLYETYIMSKMMVIPFKKSLLQPVTRTKKIFVGGLAAQTTPDDLKNYFQQFGKVSPMLDNFKTDPLSVGFTSFFFVPPETERFECCIRLIKQKICKVPV